MQGARYPDRNRMVVVRDGDGIEAPSRRFALNLPDRQHAVARHGVHVKIHREHPGVARSYRARHIHHPARTDGGDEHDEGKHARPAHAPNRASKRGQSATAQAK
jgi:hypothetical protein